MYKMKMYKLSNPYYLKNLEEKEIKRICENDYYVYYDVISSITNETTEKRELKRASKHTYYDNLKDAYDVIEDKLINAISTGHLIVNNHTKWLAELKEKQSELL